MTELTPETITDEQVNSFFENEGEIKDIQPEVNETPAKEEPIDENLVNFWNYKAEIL